MTTFPVLDGYIAHPLLAAGKKSSNSKMLKEWDPKCASKVRGVVCVVCDER
jgi:hypothetical protein